MILREERAGTSSQKDPVGAGFKVRQTTLLKVKVVPFQEDIGSIVDRLCGAINIEDATIRLWLN